MHSPFIPHYYKNFTGGRRFRFSTAGKAVRCSLEATVNRGLTAVGKAFSTAGKAVRRGLEATVNRGLTAAGGLARRG